MRGSSCGQLLRIVGAATKTFIGLVPAGNTGGANVSAVRPMPLDPELAAIIEKARSATATSYQLLRSSRSFTNTVRASGFSPISGKSLAQPRDDLRVLQAAETHSRASLRPAW